MTRFARILSRAAAFGLALCLAAALPEGARAQTPVTSTGAQSLVTASPDPNHELLSSAFQADTDAGSRSKLTSGNAFHLLENGVRSFPEKLAIIATATSQIQVCTMSWAWDATGKAMIDALAAKRRQGLDVRAIVDGLACDPRVWLKLRSEGVKVVRYNPWGLNIRRKGRVHEKAVIVDCARAIVGGMNIGDDFALGNGLNAHFKDTDLYVEGYAAVEASRRFFTLYTDLDPQDAAAQASLAAIASRAQPAAAPTPGAAGYGRVIANEPDLGKEYITDFYVRCFRAAKSQIVWHVKYAAPEEPLLSELKAAAARGVRVVIITNSPRAYDEKAGSIGGFFLELWTRRFNLDRFRGPGIEVWEYDHYIHSKALTIDGVMASIGSYNFDMWSVRKETELTLVTYDPGVVRAVEEMFDRDKGLSRRIQ